MNAKENFVHMNPKFFNFKPLQGLVLLCFLLFSFNSFAQEEEKVEEKKEKVTKLDLKSASEQFNKYRRSSLHTMLLVDEGVPRKELVLEAFDSAPFPDKYNDHTVDGKHIPVVVPLRDTSDLFKRNDMDFSKDIEAYFAKNKTANKLVAKWFCRDENGAFNMSLIQERGFYDASVLDVSSAQATGRGTASLADAGEDLIANTFVVVNFSSFVSNEPYARIIKEKAYSLADKFGEEIGKTMKEAADSLYSQGKDGYSIWTTAYLYELVWDDYTSAVFYKNLWVSPSKMDSSRVAAFDTTDVFKLKLLGFEKSRALITGLGDNAASEEMIIKNATIKSIDAGYAKLQKKFERFRSKSVLFSVEPLAAKIGMKEGVEKNDKFEVLEQVIDKDGKMTYKKLTVIKVEKDHIWDNRYRADEGRPEEAEPAEIKLDENGNPIIVEVEEVEEWTTFKGKTKDLYPGLLIRQIK